MPLIQELPNTTHKAEKPGWAYVPDTGHDPSKAPILTAPAPPGKRARRNVVVAGGGAGAGAGGGGAADKQSARQQAKVTQHLASLERENGRDVTVVLPGRGKDVGGRGMPPFSSPPSRESDLSL